MSRADLINAGPVPVLQRTAPPPPPPSPEAVALAHRDRAMSYAVQWQRATTAQELVDCAKAVEAYLRGP